MAPDLALQRLPKKRGRRTLTVLDPMMGSGTIPVLASIAGHRAIGFDTDPLAVTIARTWARPMEEDGLLASADRVREWARSTAHRPFRHPDEETQAFIDYWFDKRTQRRLGALAQAIEREPLELRDALWCGFSRLIITKDAGASRARDVSHSRPHRVRSTASFNPLERYPVAVRAVVDRHQALQRKRAGARRLRLQRGDARALPLTGGTVDVVMTSPPYLQAIDYLRGHRLSLVWMGYELAELRDLRSASIGTERGLPESDWLAEALDGVAGGPLSTRGTAIVQQYVSDLSAVLGEVRRVLRPDGRAIFVVAEATLEGVPIKLSAALRATAARNGFRCVQGRRRDLPASRRYLPPPKAGGENSLDRRMKTEWCFTLRPVKAG